MVVPRGPAPGLLASEEARAESRRKCSTATDDEAYERPVTTCPDLRERERVRRLTSRLRLGRAATLSRRPGLAPAFGANRQSQRRTWSWGRASARLAS